MEAITAAAADVDAAAAVVTVGAEDMHDRQLRPLQSTAVPTVIADMAAKNAHILLTDKRRRRTLHT